MGMENDKTIEFIENIELFRGLSREELQRLAQNMARASFTSDELLFEAGQPRRGIYVLHRGEVELFVRTAYGREKHLAVFSEGDFLGEGSWTDDAPHSTSARALAETTALVIEREFFEENGDLAVKVFSNVARVISRRMRHANNRAVHSAAQYESGKRRLEHDLLGERQVPDEVYYGVQTLRALENFNISGVSLNFYPRLVVALAEVKKAAALANHELGLLPAPLKDAICRACTDIIKGRYHYHFVVDMIQGGAGTSTNMNANEVIANRALEHLGREKGDYDHCHPNNHVNLSQSTNDVYPTAVKIALYRSNRRLVRVLEELSHAFRERAMAFSQVLKMGRTQLQDAVPMTLGQSFEAYAVTLEEELQRLNENARLFLEINMGATAIGTGINADPGYAAKVVRHLRRVTDLDLVNALNLVEATQDTGSFVMYSSAVKRLALKLSKICNDLRLLSSGPRAGLGEINLPPMQPGSSIMPGKVNPVIPEVVNQIAFKVMGNDLTVSMAAEAGQLELNVMEPVIVHSLLESIEMLRHGINTLNHRCVSGITANAEHCRRQVESSIGLVTALNPLLGYEGSSAVAKEALHSGRGVYELVLEKGLLSREELDEALKPENMVHPGRLRRTPPR